MSTMTLRLEAYAKDAKQAISAAQAVADERRHPEVEPLHLLYTLVDGHDDAADAVERAGIDPTDVLVEAEMILRKMASVRDVKSYLSPRMLDLLGRAEGEAARQGGVRVGVDHLMLACAQETDGGVKDVFKAVGLSAPILRATLGGDRVGGGEDEGGEKKRSVPGAPPKRRRGSEDIGDPIEAFGRDLTRLANQGKFDPTVGRDGEIRRMLQVLARRRENNPLLVGEPGIGKTAIVQALAQRIAVGDVPTFFKNKRIVALEMGSLVAGASLRGQLEERTRAVLDAIRDSAGEILLFLPDLGALTGAKPSGAGDLISAALARGELKCIAVATPDAVRKAQDDDAGLFRRFVGIPIEPPTLDEAIAVLRGVVGRFEIDHGVRIGDPALVSAATFARRYIPGVQLPKSAIDLIDEAAARVRVEMESEPSELDSLKRRLEAIEIQRASLEDDHDAESVRNRERLEKEAAELKPRLEDLQARWEKELRSVGDVRRLKEEVAAANRELEQVRASGDHARAGELRFGTIPLLEKQLAEASEGIEDVDPSNLLVHDTVTPQDVADVVALWTGVPVSKMLEEETTKLLRMEDTLRERVVGQDHAVSAISKAVRRGRVGLRDPRRPIGSFLFLGPTGVGKTELAKALAEFLFDDEASLTRLDMSEFMEKHTVARLLGAPPGYKDSDAGGFLTEAVRNRPYSVVLFDEMEKAHPDVFNITLQVLDDGRLTDSRGRPAYFSDTVIIMTSNVGSHLILDHEGTNEELKEKVEEELHRTYRPEFLNRIDDVVIFDPLGKDDLLGIADIQLRNLEKLLAHRRIGLEVTEEAKNLIVELGYEPAFGARPLKRVILKSLQDPMAQTMLEGGYGGGDTVLVDVEGDGFTFTKK
ncbi:MAG TPA: AAA family ATPase [Polyangiaceae bacterium LLY-WYZ-15_(1-7)]|nr:AAA family ATPase [Polyangiaceae bacterium LLY-WYZ-15_(1-7)]